MSVQNGSRTVGSMLPKVLTSGRKGYAYIWPGGQDFISKAGHDRNAKLHNQRNHEKTQKPTSKAGSSGKPTTVALLVIA